MGRVARQATGRFLGDTGRVTAPHAPTPSAASRSAPTTRTKVLLSVFGALALFGMLVAAVSNHLLAPAKKTLVVTMQQTAGEADRQQLKSDCGALAGVVLVADRGNPDPRIQGRFPVRFDIGRATAQQEARLETCINGHDTVRGFLAEGDN